MNRLLLLLAVGLGGINICLADLTIVQSVEGMGAPSTVTMKIKGDKCRVDSAHDVATLFDAKTGEMLQLLKGQKTVIRMSGEKMKQMTELLDTKKPGASPAAGKAQLTPTGKKQKVNGYDVEEYVTETPSFKASYWVAPSYPNSAAIFQQLRLIKPSWDFAKMGIPDFAELPGLPIKTVMSLGATQVTSTIVSVRQDPLPDSDFVVPPDFKEVEMPDLSRLMQKGTAKPESKDSTEP